jgi:hypothetical protein
LLFGQEGPGLSEAARAASALVCSIAQYGSTRSINAGVASAIAMHTWIRQHAEPPPDAGVRPDTVPNAEHRWDNAQRPRDLQPPAE